MIPHIACWGSPFSWRGDIHFENADGWNRFFGDYEKWIVESAGRAMNRRTRARIREML